MPSPVVQYFEGTIGPDADPLVAAVHRLLTHADTGGIVAAVTTALRPRPRRSAVIPAMRNAANRSRHRAAFCRVMPSSAPICSLVRPAAANSTTRERST